MDFSITSLTHFLASIFTIGILLDIWFYYKRQLPAGDKETLDKSLKLFSIALALWCINDLFNLIDRNADTDKEFSNIIGGIASTLNNCAFLLSFIFFQYAPDLIKEKSGRKVYQNIVYAVSGIILIAYLILIQLNLSFAAAIIDVVFSGITLATLSILLSITFWKRGFVGIGIIAAVGCNIAVLGQILNNESLSATAPDYTLYYQDNLQGGHPITGASTLEIEGNSALEFNISPYQNGSSVICVTAQSGHLSNFIGPQNPLFKASYKSSNVDITDPHKVIAYFKLHNQDDQFAIRFISQTKITLSLDKTSKSPHIASVLYLVSFFLIISLFVALAFSWILETSKAKIKDTEFALDICINALDTAELFKMFHPSNEDEVRPNILFILASRKKPANKEEDERYQAELEKLEIKFRKIVNEQRKEGKSASETNQEILGIRENLYKLFFSSNQPK